MEGVFAWPCTWPPTSDVDAELEELSMNAGSTPERVGYTHLADQPTNLDGQLRPAGCSRSRFPAPEGAKGGAMPAANRLGAANGNRLRNSRCKSVKQYENEAIEPAEGRALGCAPTEYIQLLAKRDYLGLKRPSRPE